MENLHPPPVRESMTKCALCKSELPASKIYCLNCGYPQNGSKEQKDQFKQEREKTKSVLRSAKNKVKGAAGVLGGIGAVIFIFSLALGGGLESFIGIILGCGLGLIFVALSIWSNFRPLPAIILGTFIYGSILAVDIVLSVSTIGIPGFLALCLKLILLGVLVSGISGARKAAELEESLKK